MTTENQQTIEEWRLATFGPGGSNARMAARLNEEMAELLAKLTTDRSTRRGFLSSRCSPSSAAIVTTKTKRSRPRWGNCARWSGRSKGRCCDAGRATAARVRGGDAMRYKTRVETVEAERTKSPSYPWQVILSCGHLRVMTDKEFTSAYVPDNTPRVSAESRLAALVLAFDEARRGSDSAAKNTAYKALLAAARSLPAPDTAPA